MDKGGQVAWGTKRGQGCLGFMIFTHGSEVEEYGAIFPHEEIVAGNFQYNVQILLLGEQRYLTTWIHLANDFECSSLSGEIYMKNIKVITFANSFCVI